MGFFNNIFSPKRQRIIEAVRNYYNGNASRIPYTAQEIHETLEWVQKSNIDNKEMLIEKLTMAELLVKVKSS